MESLLAALEASAAAHSLRQSVWLYPLANVLHVLGAMGFFAAVAAMDVKALGRSPAAEVRTFVGRLRPFAIAFFLVQLVTGIMLFLPEATHIARNVVFLLKVGTILLAVLNVVLLETALARRPAAATPPGVRLAAAASIVLWLGVATLGRLIAYF